MTTQDEGIKKSDLRCTSCWPRTWATWEVVTEDGISFVCDRHHVEMSEAKIIRLERMKGKKTWNKFNEIRDFYEEYLDDVSDLKDENDCEYRRNIHNFDPKPIKEMCKNPCEGKKYF